MDVLKLGVSASLCVCQGLICMLELPLQYGSLVYVYAKHIFYSPIMVAFGSWSDEQIAHH